MWSDLQARRAAAVDIARRYLALMEQRDLEGASRLVHQDAVFIFPGGAARDSLADIVAGSARRYHHVGKTIEACDACIGDDCAVVYVRGALHGRWLDGRDFTGIRFIDRFEISGGLILRQDVWNDAGEFRV
jgi:hypothetical protein